MLRGFQFIHRYADDDFAPDYPDYLVRIIDPFDNRSRRLDRIRVGREFRSSMRNVRVTPVAGYGLLLRSLPVLRRQRYINIAATHRNTSSRARSDCRVTMS